MTRVVKWPLSPAASALLIALAACEDPAKGPVELSFAPCAGAADNPTWFAFQDGDGPWARVNASSSASYDFSLRSGRGGIAMVTPGIGLFVVYATTAELQASLPACNGSIRTVSGSVTGFTPEDNVSIAMGSSNDVAFGPDGAPQDFRLSGVDATSSDLVLVRYRTTSSEAYPNSVFLRRNVTGSSTSVADFSSPTEAGAPVSREVTVANLLAGEGLTVLSYVALVSTTANIARYEALPALSAGPSAAPFYAIASSRLHSGETQMLRVSTLRTTSASTQEGRQLTIAQTDPRNGSVVLGPSLGPITVTGSSRPGASYAVQGSYDNLFDVVFQQNVATSFRQVEVLATSAYFRGAGIVTLTVPDLSSATGFSSNWLLVPGVPGTWSFLASNASLALLTGKAISYLEADRLSTFTP